MKMKAVSNKFKLSRNIRYLENRYITLFVPEGNSPIASAQRVRRILKII